MEFGCGEVQVHQVEGKANTARNKTRLKTGLEIEARVVSQATTNELKQEGWTKEGWTREGWTKE